MPRNELPVLRIPRAAWEQPAMQSPPPPPYQSLRERLPGGFDSNQSGSAAEYLRLV